MAALTLQPPHGNGYGGYGGVGEVGFPFAPIAWPPAGHAAPAPAPTGEVSLLPPGEIAAVQNAAGSSPPDAIIISGPDFYKSHLSDLYGGYKRTRNLYGKATYQKDPDQGLSGQPEAFIYWSAADSRWCVSKELGATIWNGLAKSDDVIPVPIYQMYEEDGEYPRVRSTWVANLFGYASARHQSEHMLYFEALELPLEASDPAKLSGGNMHVCRRRFVDYCFPPSVVSLEGDPPPLRVPGQRTVDTPVTWTPAVVSALEKQGALFRASTEPCGDWLMGLHPAQGGRHPLFAAVREYPGYLESLFMMNLQLNSLGQYYVSLFDVWQNVWRRLVIDDFVPMSLVDPQEGGLLPWAGGHGRTLWASLLDKALAKVCGSYLALDESEPGPILATICGQRLDACARWVRDGGWWSRWCFLPPERRRPFCDEGHSRVQDAKALRVPTDRVAGTWHQNSELFNTLLLMHRQNALLYAYRFPGRGHSGGPKPARCDPGSGLVHGHGYSILQLVDADAGEGATSPVALVQLRNIWGAETCWRGAWAENSAEWERFPAIRRHHQRPEHEGSGRFWMAWVDFCSHFDRVEVCPMPSAARKASYAPSPVNRAAPRVGAGARRHPRDSGAGGGGLWQCCSVELAEPN